MRTTAVKRTDTRPVDSEGDVNTKLNDLENFLTKFNDDDDDETEQVEISGVSDLAKILKPKVRFALERKRYVNCKFAGVRNFAVRSRIFFSDKLETFAFTAVSRV